MSLTTDPKKLEQRQTSNPSAEKDSLRQKILELLSMRTDPSLRGSGYEIGRAVRAGRRYDDMFKGQFPDPCLAERAYNNFNTARQLLIKRFGLADAALR